MAIPKLPFSAGGTSSLGLESLTPEERSLLLARKNYLNTQQFAQQLGVEGGGVPRRGFLSASLDYLTRPQSATLGFLTGLTGLTQEGEETNPFLRALQGLSGEERFTGGELLGETPEDASLAERFGRGALGFGIDVATDPLTYLTFGGGGVLRGAAKAAATEAEVAKSARRVLQPIRLPEVPITSPVEAATATQQAGKMALTRAGDIRTSDQPVIRMGTQRTTATKAPTNIELPDTFEGRYAQGSNISRVKPIEEPLFKTEEDDIIQRISSAAGEGQALKGPYGARKGIEKTLLDQGYTPDKARELTKDILSGTTSEIRGSTGIRLPFLGKSDTGKIVSAGESSTRRVLDLTPGSGYLVDDLGLRSMAEASRNLFNNYRSRGFYQGWARNLNGKFGEEYAKVVKNAYTGKGGMDYKTFTKTIADENKRTAIIDVIDKNASSILITAKNMVDNSKNPEAVDRYKDQYAMMADDMRLNPNAGEDEKLGFEIASYLREQGENSFNNEVKEAALYAGVDIGDISTIARNWLPRPITKDEIARRAKEGKESLAYTTDKSRRLGFDTDQYGRLENASNAELNQRFIDLGIRPKGHKTFETDAISIATQQLASYREVTNKLLLIGDLKRTGLLSERTFDEVKLLNLPSLVKKGEDIKTTIGKIEYDLRNGILNNNITDIDKANKAIEKIAANKEVINGLLANLQDVDPNSTKVIGNLMSVLKSSLNAGESSGIKLTKKEKENLFSRDGLVQVRQTGGNLEDLLSRNLQPIGLEKGIKLPRGLSNLYADETVRDAVEKYFKVETNALSTSKFFNEVYKPYYTLFKTYTTVGRPGGYHSRNLQGAWWNNYLGDVSAKDHNLSAKILFQLNKAQKDADRAIDSIRNGKASGLDGDANKLANDIVKLSNARGSQVADFEISQLTEYLALKQLSKIKVTGNISAAEVLTSARDNLLFKGNRTLEYLSDEARLGGRELSEALLNPNKVNLFKGKSKEELNLLQRGANAAMNFTPIAKSGQVADISENYVRLAAYLSGVKRFGLEDNGNAAALFTKALQFDYKDLSETERLLMKNILPFYTWSRRNIPLQFNALLSQPGKFNKLGFAKDELQNQFGADGDDELMNDLVPDFMKERMGFVTRFTGEGLREALPGFLKPLVRSGGPLAIAGPGFESPAFDLNRFTPGEGELRKEIVSASNPLAKAFIESMIDVDTFTGQKFPEEPVEVIPGLPDVPSKYYNLLKDLVPPLGTIARLGTEGDADRRLSSILSTFAGASVSTQTLKQNTAELRTREDRLVSKIEGMARSLGVEKAWLKDRLKENYTSAEIQQLVRDGYGRP